MAWKSSPNRVVVAAAVAVVCLVGTATYAASAPSPTVKACVTKYGYIQDVNGLSRCPSFTTVRSISVTGPRGPRGPAGPAGLQGSPGNDGADGVVGPIVADTDDTNIALTNFVHTTVATVTVPAGAPGTYMIFGGILARAVSADPSVVECSVEVNSGNVTGTGTGGETVSTAPGSVDEGSMTFATTRTLLAGDVVNLNCISQGVPNPADAQADSRNLTAIRIVA